MRILSDVHAVLGEFHRIATQASFDPTQSRRRVAQQSLAKALAGVRRAASAASDAPWRGPLIDNLEVAETVSLAVCAPQFEHVEPQRPTKASLKKLLKAFQDGIGLLDGAGGACV